MSIRVAVEHRTSYTFDRPCNNRLVPLQPTSTAGTFVAGVRFRAWQPPSALHPTIGVHSPLVFDVVDSWSGMPGRVEISPPQPPAEHPRTLDLRRP